MFSIFREVRAQREENDKTAFCHSHIPILVTQGVGGGGVYQGPFGSDWHFRGAHCGYKRESFAAVVQAHLSLSEAPGPCRTGMEAC